MELNELQRLAAAFDEQGMRYTFTASEHPSTPGVYRFVFSRPTNAAPESAVYINADITRAPNQNGRGDADDAATYRVMIEGLRWPYYIKLRDGIVDEGGFPESLLERVDLQKCKVNERCLWT
ncbi:uncharacterized protein TEOVI_000817700 [Trypanosoma equiperdum]|uniref:Uncharacterized protein n=4 Tax=Trypanozoon TaxID=39700 RepID=Q583U6_TRYB2|nr:hypothetical protein, conserved [Trypanosoma brucei gambiense DAL972]XP_845180.1 hypothetical protein, conserved [Trypanosoma brucei brucei TREU927]AAX80462.1 hypothetical protein, conserved [Trypanosoma brucei]RHW71983.1 hypothetical protein DPX39_060010100 [Trypanosoma brucei equiperdum]SCU67279.1 conserved protein [Trypanosoma equiperdum]AAZ11621.1 hypothetical protein, conserved [Trypanosoma brucei brucei TREU927]CBH11543.1 hypothetical protein, conserved [Trypanosoma brucei gambiense |eukprot:XP_011773828.1 hypothetical protein, conserved [Trypanosoma brucei gambiense DAL972]